MDEAAKVASALVALAVEIPPEVAYGAEGHPLSGQTLVFEIEWLEAAEMPPGPPPLLTEMPRKR